MPFLETICPGCGLSMPRRETADNDSYYNASAECWAVYTEVLAAEFSNAVLFGRVHQLSVDAYAAQHAGGSHPDKSVMIHLAGLFLMLEKRLKPTAVPPLLQLLAARISAWPHYSPPNLHTPLTVFDVALAATLEEQIELVRRWAGLIWTAWSDYHIQIADVISQHLKPELERASAC